MRLRTRRSFLAVGSLALGGTLLAPWNGSDPLSRLYRSIRRRDPGDVSLDEFASHLGSRVHLRTPDGVDLRATLTRAESTCRDAKTNAKVEQFRLTFASTPRTRPEQGTYQVHHPELGLCDLFLVPVSTREEGGTTHVELEACFSRLVG